MAKRVHNVDFQVLEVVLLLNSVAPPGWGKKKEKTQLDCPSVFQINTKLKLNILL